MYLRDIRETIRDPMKVALFFVLPQAFSACGESSPADDGRADAFVGADAGIDGGTEAARDGGPRRCLHDVCIEGAVLDPSCSPCAAFVGEEEEYCKYIRWQDFCVDIALSHPEVCTCAPERECADLVDQDRDGRYDCDDSDCRDSGACATGATAVGGACDETSDCAAAGGDPLCLDAHRWEWPDGFCTELCSLAPDDCPEGSACQDIGLPAGRGVCQVECDPETPACREGYECRLDRDAGPFCQPRFEVCDNAIDDDLDGSVDCAEWDCLYADGCGEICDNGLDDNGAAGTDCEDLRCLDHPACASRTIAACEELPAARSSCAPVGEPGFPCDPITSGGCLPGQTCDLVGGTFLCFDEPNDVGYCERCDGLRGRCMPGATCMFLGPIRCAPFCCTDDDCGPSAVCNHAYVATGLSRAESPVGVCVTR
jgi:hypothetical protein